MQDRFGLYVVADGMGGYEGGEIASSTAVETLVCFFERTTPQGDIGLGEPDDGFALARRRVDLALRMANREIGRKSVGALGRMGSTIASIVIQHEHALIAHVGDSRVYRLRGGKLEAMTRDHSLRAELEMRAMSLPDGAAAAYRHVVTRALGVPGDSHPDLRVEAVLPGDLFLLTTDGVTEVLSDEAIESWARKKDPAVLPAELVRAAFDAGSHDNITAVVVSAQA